MKGYLTSYVGIFDALAIGRPGVSDIEIPLIQRDYAQGRPDAQAAEIRTRFLEVLLAAIAGDEPVGLDFVYGRIESGRFRPLDGQQRLTTLFLLHWYLASAAGCLDADAAWARFSYETRPSARRFCQLLAANPLPANEHSPSGWLTDQAWYQHGWHHDPTIQAMLVMLDAIHTRLSSGHDPRAMWERLTDAESPAVSFYLLPLDDMESDDDLYIKMNSRGKPLTPFETFKARLEQDIRHADRADEFAQKIDGAWSDLLWPFHGSDNLVDVEFMNYLGYIVELCELREGRVVSGPVGPRARNVFGADNPRAGAHIDFLFDAFDSWQDAEHVRTVFTDSLTTALPNLSSYDWQKVVQFGGGDTNLFLLCLRRGPAAMPMPQRLLLYAFLLHLIGRTEDFPRRLRRLRNLIEASENELRSGNLPALVNDVEAVIVNDDLGAVQRFNGNQIADERRKQAFLELHPDLTPALCRLEDHRILRGALNVFELDSETFAPRARAFETAFADRRDWLKLTGALLTFGDYQQQWANSESWQFGTSSPDHESVWRDLLAIGSYQFLRRSGTVLAGLLDGLAAASSSAGAYFQHVIEAWLADREAATNFDWRYHLVKYEEMRTGVTGGYYGVEGRLGYSMCMMRTTRRSGKYRDPILLQVWRSSGAGDRVEDPWFRGYETIPRWLRLVRSNVGIRSIDSGFALDLPDDEAVRATLTDVFDQYGVAQTAGGAVVLPIPQREGAGGPVDTIDRVIVGATFLRVLVQAGL